MHPLFLIVAHPVRAAEQLQRTPRWLGAFLAIAAGLVVLRLVSQTHLVEATLAALPPTATSADRAWARSILDNDLLMRCAFLPLRQIAGMGAFALFLYLLCAASGPPVRARFAQVFAFEVHAEVLNLLGGYVSFAVARFVPDAKSAGFGTFALLTSTNIFTLWYVVALTAGILTLFGFSKVKAGLLASAAWIVSALFNDILLQSVSASMHLRV